MPEIEAGRADQIADVLDEQQIDMVEVERMQRIVDHVGVEVTGLSRRDLDRGNAPAANALGVVLCFQVAFDHGDPDRVGQRIDRRLQQAGLARSG